MANPQQEAAIKEANQRQNELRFEYQQLVASYAGKDLLAHLSERRDILQNLAGEEMDSLDKKALYLQEAYAYGKVIAYISDLTA